MSWFRKRFKYGLFDEISLERGRQLLKGYSPKHDDEHSIEELIRLSHVYTYSALGTRSPSTVRSDLIKAAAVLVATIESLDRREKKS